MTIRKAVLGDIEQIEKTMEIGCFGERKPDWERVINDPDSIMYIMEDDNQLIGFTGMEWSAWKHAFELVNIYVSPKYRGQGLAQKLLDKLVSHATETSARAILAQTSQEAALARLLEKLGFEVCGSHDYWYDNDGLQKAIFYAKRFR